MADRPPDDSETTHTNCLLRVLCNRECFLIVDLRRRPGERLDVHTRPFPLVLVNRLIQNLRIILELASQNGYLNNVLQRLRNWPPQIQALHQAILDFVTSIELIRDCFELQTPVAAISKKLELRLGNWINSFSAMRRQERTMLQAVISIDHGGEA